MTEQAEGRREGISTDHLAQSARDLLQNLPAIDSMLHPLFAGGTTTGAFSLSREQLASIGSNVLWFMGLATFTPWAKVAERLGSAGLTEDEISAIRAFAEKYRSCDRFLFRAYRAERGFENEITHIGARPILYLKSEEFLIQLELYSHDKLALVCYQELDDVMRLVRQLLETVYESLEDAAEIRKDLPAEVFRPEVVQQVVEAAEALYKLIPKPLPSNDKHPSESEPDTGEPTS